MPMLRVSVAMITSQQPSSAALPAKQRPATMPTSGTWPESAANWRRCDRRGRRRSGMSVSPGRPPPPSANSTTGSVSRRAMREHAVGLLVVAHALRAGEHRVVVGHHHAARLLGAERAPLTLPMPVTMPSAGVLRDQVVERAAAALRGERQRAVFDEAAGSIAQVGDVLARRALPALARFATASGRAASSVSAWRSMHLCRSGRISVEIVLGGCAASPRRRRPARARTSASPFDQVSRRRARSSASTRAGRAARAADAPSSSPRARRAARPAARTSPSRDLELHQPRRSSAP